MADTATKSKENLITIGVIAKSFGVNENTIRRIEAAGLIKPAVTSQSSGYRYYDSNNVSLLAEIFALRSFGFTYEDLIEYFRASGDYSCLYNKLIAKQSSVDMMVEKLKRRMTIGFLQEQFIQYVQAECLYKEVFITPDVQSFCEATNSFLYEAIRTGQEIDYTRSIMILSECMDYQIYRWDLVQKLTFCIPLITGTKQPRTLHIPSSTAVACRCLTSDTSFCMQESINMIDRTFSNNGLQQSDTLRFSYHVRGNLEGKDNLKNAILHMIVPFA